MATVMKLVIRGVQVEIRDDLYRDCSEQELERRKAEAKRVAGRMLAELIEEGKMK